MGVGEAAVVKERALKEVYVRQASGLVRNVGPTSALLSNLVGMGIVVNIFWVVYASAFYPQVNLADTVLFALVLNALVAYVYWMLATAMPRTGGDYVFVGRIFHPAAGFMVNAVFTIIMVTWAGLFPTLTVSQGLQMVFANLYILTGNPTYGDLAATLGSNSDVQLALGALLVTLVVLTMLLSTRNIFRVVIGLFAFQAIVYAVFIGLLATTSHDAFVARFDALSGTTAAQVIATGGGPVPFAGPLTLATFTGVVYTMLSFIGYANSAYFAGELRGDPKRSQGIAIFVSPIVFAALIYVLYAVIYSSIGHDFVVASSTWWYCSSSGACPGFTGPAYPLLSLPSPAHLVVFMTDSPLIATLVPLGLVATFMGFAIVYFFVPTRNLFAWAFDRVVPTSLAAVNRRGVPYAAVLVYGAIAYASLYLTVKTTVFSYLTYSNFGWWVAVALVCLAGAAFPFARRNLYAAAPPIVRLSLGPVPVLTLVGAAGFVLSLFVSWASISPDLLGAGSPINPWWVGTFFLIMAAALVVYAVSYAYHKGRGVPIELAFKELPPE